MNLQEEHLGQMRGKGKSGPHVYHRNIEMVCMSTLGMESGRDLKLQGIQIILKRCLTLGCL